MHTLRPTSEQIKDFMTLPDNKPLVMINLLKFKDWAEENNMTGIDLYQRYTEKTAPLLNEVGGRLLWMGTVKQVFIGTENDYWNRVMLVEYPSRSAFIKMITMPEYEEIHKDRESALVDSLLLAGFEDFKLSSIS